MRGILGERPGAIPLIRRLRGEGYGVYYLSNFSYQALDTHPWIRPLLSEMDGGILSCEEHLTKPDPAIYRLLLERYSLTAARCVFLDDTPRNVAAARELGIHGIVVESMGKALEELRLLLGTGVVDNDIHVE